MTKYANLKIRKITAYNPPIENRRKFSDEGGTLCDFNEMALDKDIANEIRTNISNQDISMYPEYTNGLIEQIAKYCGVANDQVLLTNGSDQGIDLIFRTFTNNGDKVVIPAPSFAMFYQWAYISGNKIVSPIYRKLGEFPLSEILKNINKGVKLVIVCNPNNPTGTIVSLNNIEKILQKALRAGSLVYIDEAYYEFSGITATRLISKYPNLLITRTFSKAFALAGLRIGYVLGQNNLLMEMKKILGPYDVNMVAVVAAKTSFKYLSKIRKNALEVIKGRALLENFFKRKGVDFWPSKANFVLFSARNSQKIYEKLVEAKIRIRKRDGVNIENTLRISIGSLKEIKKIIKILEEIIPQKYAFIDRDGTLIFEPQDTYQVDGSAQLKILDGSIFGLKDLLKKGFKLVMVTNQDGLGTKNNPRDNFDLVQRILLKTLAENDIIFDQILICPHFSFENCNCRKPKIGLFEKFARTANIDLQNSIMIGDRPSDKQFAKNSGIKFLPMKTNGKFLKLSN